MTRRIRIGGSAVRRIGDDLDRRVGGSADRRLNRHCKSIFCSLRHRRTAEPTTRRPPISKHRRPAEPPNRRTEDLFAWRFRTAFAVGLLSLTLSINGWAISERAGTKNGNFLKIPTDARGAALGDVSVSMVKGAESLRWNPAGLSSVETKEAGGTHVQYYQGVQVENVYFAYPLEESGIAVSGFYLSPGDLDGRDISGNATGDFKFYDLVGTLGYGRRMLTRAEGLETSIGVALKLVQEKIAEQQFQNPAVDAGILVSPLEKLNVGLAIRNFSSSKANFPKEFVGGASYTLFNVFTGGFALNYANDAPVHYTLGGEYRFTEWDSAVRLGYRNHDTLDDSEDSAIPALRNASVAGLTMGAGFQYEVPALKGVKLELDYAMAPFGALGISHTVSVKTKW